MWQLLSNEYEWYIYLELDFSKNVSLFINRLAIAGANEVQIKKIHKGKRNALAVNSFFDFNQLVCSLCTTVYTDLLEIVIMSISRLVDFLIIGLSNPLKNSIKVLLQWHQWQWILHVQWKLMQSFRRRPFTDSIPGCNNLVLFFFMSIAKKRAILCQLVKVNICLL